VRSLRALAAAALVALIVLALAWELWLAPLRPGGSLLALKALPLALPLGGILAARVVRVRRGARAGRARDGAQPWFLRRGGQLRAAVASRRLAAA
jgi:hypothetical protein